MHDEKCMRDVETSTNPENVGLIERLCEFGEIFG